MYEESLLLERLEMLLSALERIPRRFLGIKTANDFLNSDDGLDKLDAICMILVATGEAFKQMYTLRMLIQIKVNIRYNRVYLWV
jgi:hypothetical protein